MSRSATGSLVACREREEAAAARHEAAKSAAARSAAKGQEDWDPRPSPRGVKKRFSVRSGFPNGTYSAAEWEQALAYREREVTAGWLVERILDSLRPLIEFKKSHEIDCDCMRLTSIAREFVTNLTRLCESIACLLRVNRT